MSETPTTEEFSQPIENPDAKRKRPRFDIEGARRINEKMRPVSDAAFMLTINFESLSKEERREHLTTLKQGVGILREGLTNKLTAHSTLRNLRDVAMTRDYSEDKENPHNIEFVEFAMDAAVELTPAIEANFQNEPDDTDISLTIELYRDLVEHGNENQKAHGATMLSKHLDILNKRLHSERHFYPYILMLEGVANFGNANEAGMAIRVLLDFCKENIHTEHFPYIITSLREIKENKAWGYAVDILANFFKQHELPATEIYFAWLDSCKSEDLHTAIFKNTTRIYELETQTQGVCKFLYEEFGIADFGRYPVEMLLKQYQEFNDNSRPYGVIVYPRNDHNGAFYSDTDKFSELTKQLKGEFSLRVAECESKMDIGRTLIKFDRKYNVPSGHKISLLILGGHGAETTIQFGGSDDRHELRIADLKGRGVRKTVNFFDGEPTIILASCSTGADAGIAQELSKTFNAKVIAPKIPTNVLGYYGSKRKGATKFRFNARYRDEDSKKLYKTGGLN